MINFSKCIDYRKHKKQVEYIAGENPVWKRKGGRYDHKI